MSQQPFQSNNPHLNKDTNSNTFNFHLLAPAPSKIPDYIPLQNYTSNSQKSIKEGNFQTNVDCKFLQSTNLDLQDKEFAFQNTISSQGQLLNSKQTTSYAPHNYSSSNLLQNTTSISSLPPCSSSSAFKLSESAQSSLYGCAPFTQGGQAKFFEQSGTNKQREVIQFNNLEPTNIESNYLPTKPFLPSNDSNLSNYLYPYGNQKPSENLGNHQNSMRFSPQQVTLHQESNKSHNLERRPILTKQFSHNYLNSYLSKQASPLRIQASGKETSSLKQNQILMYANKMQEKENEKYLQQAYLNNSHQQQNISRKKQIKQEFQPLHFAPSMPSVLGRSRSKGKIELKQNILTFGEQDTQRETSQNSVIKHLCNLDQNTSSDNKHTFSLSKSGEQLSEQDLITPKESNYLMLDKKFQNKCAISNKQNSQDCCLNHSNIAGRHFLVSGKSQNLCDECVFQLYNSGCNIQFFQKTKSSDQELEAYLQNYKESCQRKKISIDKHEMEMSFIIPLLVSSLESMEKKSLNVNKFLCQQERLIEDKYQDLINEIIEVKQQMLNSLIICKEDIQRRYQETIHLYKQNLSLLQNSQQDISINYQSIICQFNESDVDTVMKAYNSRLQSALNLVNNIGRSQLLNILKFDPSALIPFKEKIQQVSMNCLKKWRTAFTKIGSNQNKNKINNSMYKRQSLKNSQINNQDNQINNRTRKNNSDHIMRSPINSFSAQYNTNNNLKVIQQNLSNKQLNNSLQTNSQGHFGSVTDNAASSPMNNNDNNSSFFSCLEGSFQSYRGNSQDEQYNSKPNTPQNSKKSIYISFDNKDAFKTVMETDNKENAYNNFQSHNLINKSFVPTVHIPFQVPSIHKQCPMILPQEQSNQSKNIGKLEGSQESTRNNLQDNHHQTCSYLSSQALRANKNINQIKEVEEEGYNDLLQGLPENKLMKNETTNSGLIFTFKQGEMGSFLSLKDSQNFCQIDKNKTLDKIEDRVISQSLHQQKKFNDMLKGVQDNQINKNQNCADPTKVKEDNLPEMGSTHQSSQGTTNLLLESSQNFSSISANGSTKFAKSSFCFSKIEQESGQNKFGQEEMTSKPYDGEIQKLSSDNNRYQNSISEEDAQKSNFVGKEYVDLQFSASPNQSNDVTSHFCDDQSPYLNNI